MLCRIATFQYCPFIVHLHWFIRNVTYSALSCFCTVLTFVHSAHVGDTCTEFMFDASDEASVEFCDHNSHPPPPCITIKTLTHPSSRLHGCLWLFRSHAGCQLCGRGGNRARLGYCVKREAGPREWKFPSKRCDRRIQGHGETGQTGRATEVGGSGGNRLW